MRAAIALTLSMALLAAPSAQTQQASQQQNSSAPGQQTDKNKQPGVIHAVTEIVLIDAQVIDRSGKPIKGLKREQFSVSEDDKTQEISSF